MHQKAEESTRKPSLAPLLAMIEKLLLSCEYEVQAIISDFTGHPTLHALCQLLSRRLPAVPHIAVNSSCTCPTSFKHLLSRPSASSSTSSSLKSFATNLPTFQEFAHSYRMFVNTQNLNYCEGISCKPLSLLNPDTQLEFTRHVSSCLSNIAPRVINDDPKVTLVDWVRIKAGTFSCC